MISHLIERFDLITQVVVFGVMEYVTTIAKRGAQIHVVIHGNILMLSGVKEVWSPYHVV